MEWEVPNWSDSEASDVSSHCMQSIEMFVPSLRVVRATVGDGAKVPHSCARNYAADAFRAPFFFEDWNIYYTS